MRYQPIRYERERSYPMSVAEAWRPDCSSSGGYPGGRWVGPHSLTRDDSLAVPSGSRLVLRRLAPTPDSPTAATTIAGRGREALQRAATRGSGADGGAHQLLQPPQHHLPDTGRDEVGLTPHR